MHLTLVKREITHTEKHTRLWYRKTLRMLRKSEYLAWTSMTKWEFSRTMYECTWPWIFKQSFCLCCNTYSISNDSCSYESQLQISLPTLSLTKALNAIRFICNSKNDVHFKIKSPVIDLFRHLLSVTYMCRARENMNKVMLCNDVWYIETNFPVHYQLDVICCDPCQCWHELSFITN